MLGVLLGLVIWILGFAAAGLGFFSLFDPVLAELFDLIMTWVSVPVVALALLTVYRGGIPSGAGELRAALGWIAEQNEAGEPVDFEEAPVNPLLVALELGAATLATFGLVVSTFFSLMIAVTTIGAFGQAVADPTRMTLAGVGVSDAFGVFLAGGLLWQVAWLVEAFEAT